MSFKDLTIRAAAAEKSRTGKPAAKPAAAKAPEVAPKVPVPEPEKP